METTKPNLARRAGAEAIAAFALVFAGCGAVVSNAVYDATGVRLRRAPFRKERVLAALRAAQS